MSRINTSHIICYFARDNANGGGKAGDSANHTLRYVADGGTPGTPAASPVEVDATNLPGVYKLSVAADENTGAMMLLGGKSSTADVEIFPVQWTNEVNIAQISGDATAADNLELDYDGTGYVKANSTIGEVSALGTQAKADVNAEADTALTDYDAPTKTEMDSAFTEIKGATWDSATDTLEAIRNATQTDEYTDIIYNDTFTDSDGTYIHNHTSESGHTYSESLGLTINSNILGDAGGTTEIQNLVDSLGSDFICKVEITSAVVSVTRGSDTSNGYKLVYNSSGLELQRLVSGTPTTLDTWIGTLNNTDTITWSISANTVHSVTVNGTEQISYDDSSSPLSIGTIFYTITAFTSNGLIEASLQSNVGTLKDIVTGLLDETIDELTAIPSGTPTVKEALMLLYMWLRNPIEVTTTQVKIKDSSGSVIATATLSDNGATFTRGDYS